MAISWTKHRFSGGALALDVSNTVVHRGDVLKSFDRFEDRGEIARFAEAAAVFRASELGGRALAVSDAGAIAPTVIAIRETTDRLFRSAATGGSLQSAHLPDFLRACAAGLDLAESRIEPAHDASQTIAFGAALALSALSLLSGGTPEKIRICPNCNWLFVDRSRNASRLWCDMTVCGNRHKARRHYHRCRAVQGEAGHA